MKSSTLTALLILTLASLPLIAQESKPAAPTPAAPAPASAPAEAAAPKSDSARIAELEARVASLEKMVERLINTAVGDTRPQSGTPVARPTPSRGPDADSQQLYRKLSEAGKEKLRAFFQSHREEFQSKTPDERARLAKEALEKIAAEDKSASGQR